MGANMARRLKECGYTVSALYDVRPGAAAELAAEVGGTACTTLAQVTELSDVVITVVTDDKAQLNIFTNKKDNLLKGAAGRVFINCATLTPKVHVQVAKLAAKAKVAAADAQRVVNALSLMGALRRIEATDAAPIQPPVTPEYDTPTRVRGKHVRRGS